MNSSIAGFSIACTQEYIETLTDKSTTTEYFELSERFYAISYSQNVSKLEINGSILFIDGYTFPDDLKMIACAVEAGNYQYLNEVDGHFCGVVINQNGIVGFNDRFGGKTLYWQREDDNLVITSRISEMPIHNVNINNEVLCESFYFRWTTGKKTLLSSIEKLLFRHTVTFQNDNEITQHGYWYLPQPEHNTFPLTQKVNMAKTLLIDNLEKASKKYKKVAIFLSGGVDSSILAALSKNIFEQCYLITPVFKGEKNPELQTAKAFAKILNIEHHFVEIEPSVLTDDLKQLIALKREPLRHYSSLAIMTMMKEIPNDYEAVIYGEAADILYGANSIKRLITHSSWKKKSQSIPLFFLKLLQKFVPVRGRTLVELRKKSLREMILGLSEIQYTRSEKSIIQQLCGQSCATLEDWDWNKTTDEVSSQMLRHSAQERMLISNVAVHFNETEIIAQHYGKHLISPFFSEEAINLSATLTDNDYFGDSYVKPVLRELACEFFPRELIYQKKHGFPVPFISWLNGPLSNLISDLRAERTLFDGSLLDNLDVAENFEIYWLLINWQLVEQHFVHSCASHKTT